MSLPKFYSSWFCPFAQRAWIALLYKGVEFEYIEQNPYNKTTEWLAINPRGLVPTLVHNGKSVYESTVCIEYIDEAWKTNGLPLLPSDPYQRAYVRMWCDFVSKKCVPPFYALLMKQSQAEREEASQKILTSLEEVFRAADKTGPFFMGTEFGMADVMLAPFAERFDVILHHYRDFKVPTTEQYQRYQLWWKAVQGVDAYKKTVQPRDKLIQSYQRYADDTATTEVAVAIREGKVLP